jgi:hypothetical protein
MLSIMRLVVAVARSSSCRNEAAAYTFIAREGGTDTSASYMEPNTTLIAVTNKNNKLYIKI